MYDLGGVFFVTCGKIELNHQNGKTSFMLAIVLLFLILQDQWGQEASIDANPSYIILSTTDCV